MDYNKKLVERANFRLEPLEHIPTVILSPSVDETGTTVFTEKVVEFQEIDSRDLSLGVLLRAGVNIASTGNVNSASVSDRFTKEQIAQSFVKNLPEPTKAESAPQPEPTHE